MSDNYKDAPWLQPFRGELALKDTDSSLTSNFSHLLYKTDWSTLDGGDTPVLCTNAINNLTLVDQMDIGYQADELKLDYKIHNRLKNTRFRLIATTDKLNGSDYSETGRIIFGSETFRLNNVSMDEPLRIILRTSLTAKGSAIGGTAVIELDTVQMEDELMLRVLIDDVEIPIAPLPLAEEGFSEIYFDIPASEITSTSPEIQIIGDHISYAYWFYQ
jgi:hypothetical protein